MCWKKRCKVGPIPEEQKPKEACHSKPETPNHHTKKEEQPKQNNVPKDQPKRKKEVTVAPIKTPRYKQMSCLGFPNPVQICYMNSCLQSLLTLVCFIRDISQQQQVWSLSPNASIIRSLIDIKESHFSSNVRQKLSVLAAFKKAVSLRDSEFEDLSQKDAHEFLTSVLHQIRSLGQELQVLAASNGTIYSCPVENNMVFKMLNTRKCKSCGTGSAREEDFTNLSLDMIPGGGTVHEMIEDYQKETQLEYLCKCGGTVSGQQSSFINLPRVLVLHVKRFKYSPTYQLIKDHDPIVLSREVVVSSRKGGGCYSLVSTINHIGATATTGHYICDGVDPDVGQRDPTDRWFTYNDAMVTETSGASVCDHRQRSSYILFYQRQE
ncbi:ubiquitin carboxyl-terminal hydrolase 37-like [Seriola aureovittata]|uniref:ubiquitin carboxyl-terminal hydrolase 37-like n=1 Tax=Seriola aureovittata TaxID=2871759 RepID=UPI0024BE9018|nr:ubiquitin carboxyl-terminal hydrolase 37-like [Seriola aureovittata]